MTVTLPDTDGSVPDPVVFTEHATEINEESDNWGGRTIHVNFGAASEEFLNATGASGFDLRAKYKTNGEREQIRGRYLMAPQGKMTLRYGEIRVRSVEGVRDDSDSL